MADIDPEEEGNTDRGQAEISAPLPRENPDLVGQDRAQATLIDAYRSGRLPHAWLLTGPRGIGKTTLAFRFARFLLAGGGAGQGLFAAAAAPTSLAIDTRDPVFRRIASGGHADLLLIERGYDPKRKRRRGEIVVDDVRQIADFLHLTPAEGGWRIVIIDGADEMNRNAANALLKVLEEPSMRTLLLITSVSPGRLLPTIRSRCRKLALDPISEREIIAYMEKYSTSIGADEAGAVAALAGGSLGRAFDLTVGGGLALSREINALLADLPNLDGIAVDRLADRLARADTEDSFRLMTELLSGRLAHLIRDAARGAAATPRFIARRSLDHWVEVWEKLNRLFSQVDVINLDRKQAMLNAFFALEEASR